MKKALIIFLILFAVAGTGLYFGAGVILNIASRAAIKYLSAQIEERGIWIKEADFRSVSFRIPNSATWRKLSPKGKVVLQDLPLSGREFAVTLDEFTAGLEHFRDRLFFIKVKGLKVLLEERLQSDYQNPSQEGDLLTVDYVKMKFQFDVTRPREIIPKVAALAQDLAGLLLNGKCFTFAELSGTLNFTMNEKRVETSFLVERRGNESVLILDQEDLEKISAELEEKLNQVEIGLLSENPLKVPQLLRITSYAQDVAEEAHAKNAQVPEDAYRHVLFSYF